MWRLLEEFLDLDKEFGSQPSCRDAYCLCLRLERELATEDDQRRIRILGSLLIYTHKTSAARIYLADSILSIQDDPEILVKLGQLFEQHVIIPFKKCRGEMFNVRNEPPIPISSSLWRVQPTEAPRTFADAKEYAFLRDRGKCVVTGYLDLNVPSPHRGPGIFTDCAYIVPSAIFFEVSETSSKFDYSVTISTFLELFHPDIHKLTGERMHSLTNVMTMESSIQDHFDQLNMYLELVIGGNHLYEVKHFQRLPPLQIPRFVQFSTYDPEHLPLPDPGLLALHALVCKVAYRSGANEYIDRGNMRWFGGV